MSSNRRRGRPPATQEGAENRLISLATDLAEKQLIDGTASSQVITHLLKLGSTRNRYETEKIQNESLLLSAKLEQVASGQRVEAMYDEALAAMRSYKGQDEPEEYEESDYYVD